MKKIQCRFCIHKRGAKVDDMENFLCPTAMKYRQIDDPACDKFVPSEFFRCPWINADIPYAGCVRMSMKIRNRKACNKRCSWRPVTTMLYHIVKKLKKENKDVS